MNKVLFKHEMLSAWQEPISSITIFDAKENNVIINGQKHLMREKFIEELKELLSNPELYTEGEIAVAPVLDGTCHMITFAGEKKKTIECYNLWYWDMEGFDDCDQDSTYTKLILDLINKIQEFLWFDGIEFDMLYDEEEKFTKEIDKENIKDINYDDIIAVTVAEGGAMGEPNRFQAVDKEYQLYHSNFGDGLVSAKDLKEKFPVLVEFKCGFEDVDKLDQGWKWFNLGVGNYLLVRNEYYEDFKKIITKTLGENYKSYELYGNWYRLLRRIDY